MRAGAIVIAVALGAGCGPGPGAPAAEPTSSTSATSSEFAPPSSTAASSEPASIGTVVSPTVPLSLHDGAAMSTVDVLTQRLRSLIAVSGADGGIAGFRRGNADPVVVTAGAIDATGAPMTAVRPFPIASLTKSFTAAVIVALAADGQLDLDAPISTWIDWPDGARITVRQLLLHTSGIGPWGPSNGGSSFDTALFADLAANHPLADVVELARDVVPVGPPGAQTSYSNLNYVLAGRIAELVGGAPIAKLLADRITTPLGLDGTSYPAGIEPDLGADPLPGIFEYPEGVVVSSTDFPQAGFLSLMGPAAAAMSTVDDLFAWGDVLFRSQRLGHVDLAPLVDIGAGGYGLGVIGIDQELGSCVFTTCPNGLDFEYLGLNGEVPGAAVRLWYDPHTDTTLLVYLNRDGTSLDEPLVDLIGDLQPTE